MKPPVPTIILWSISNQPTVQQTVLEYYHPYQIVSYSEYCARRVGTASTHQTKLEWRGQGRPSSAAQAQPDPELRHHHHQPLTLFDQGRDGTRQNLRNKERQPPSLHLLYLRNSTFLAGRTRRSPLRPTRLPNTNREPLCWGVKTPLTSRCTATHSHPSDHQSTIRTPPHTLPPTNRADTMIVRASPHATLSTQRPVEAESAAAACTFRTRNGPGRS